MQAITLRLKLHRPTRTKQRLYRELTQRTTALANNLVAAGRPKGLTSKTAIPHLAAPVPSAVVNQVLRDVAVAKRVERFRVLPPSYNNQNLRLEQAGDFWTASFPTHAGRFRIPLATTRFFSGDHAAYVRRRMSSLRRRMGKAKALKAIRGMKDKETRWMKDHDHQISRQVVDWCRARGVGTIRMEDLEGIRLRGKRRKRRDQGRSLHSWSFHRLQQYITYKAALAGIEVEWVVPTNTSRTCPECGLIERANRSGIQFRCRSCSHAGHADAIGALNISRAISGLAVA